MLYICAIIFVTTVALLFTGLNLKTQRHCKAAIYICLTFYVSCKILVQMFLVERAHAARYMLKQRRDDWMWYASIHKDQLEQPSNLKMSRKTSVGIVIVGFGTIAVTGFSFPLAQFKGKPGSCKIGLPLSVTIPLLANDILVRVSPQLLKPGRSLPGSLCQSPQTRSRSTLPATVDTRYTSLTLIQRHAASNCRVSLSLWLRANCGSDKRCSYGGLHCPSTSTASTSEPSTSDDCIFRSSKPCTFDQRPDKHCSHTMSNSFG